MTDAEHRHLVIWEARHDNGWTALVMEQSDGWRTTSSHRFDPKPTPATSS